MESFFANEWNGSSEDIVIHCAAERRPDVAEKVEHAFHRIPTRQLRLPMSEPRGYPECILDLRRIWYISDKYIVECASSWTSRSTSKAIKNSSARRLVRSESASLHLGSMNSYQSPRMTPCLSGLSSLPTESSYILFL